MEAREFTVKTNPIAQSSFDEVDWDNLPFGKVFSDHMLIMDYKDGQWSMPEIKPFEDMKLHPATSAIHYGQSIFEGMKAYRTVDDEVVIFRPEMNAKRFRESANRMCMADFPEELFEFCVNQLVNFDSKWVPSKKGDALYIRPFMFATDDYIGIKPSDTYRFMIFTCPVGAYYSDALNVKIEEHYTRAASGGVGSAKTAGNYAASLYPAMQAKKEGYHQLVWTDGNTHEYIEESGTMNIMFVLDGKLITPDESEDTILSGITKRSVVELARDWGMEVEERKIKVAEIIEAAKDGRLTEAFGAGTAATIAPIQMIGFRGEQYKLPGEEHRTFSKKVFEHLDHIKVGKEADKFGWIKKV